MAKLTRRGLLKQASVGGAALGALVTVPGLASAHAASAIGAPDLRVSDRREPLAAYVRDLSKGEIAIFVGTREIVTHDPELVRRLLKAAR